MVLDNRAVQGKEVKSTGRVCMLEVWWEAERQDHVHGDFRANVLEHGRSLRDREQEDVSLLVGREGVI